MCTNFSKTWKHLKWLQLKVRTFLNESIEYVRAFNIFLVNDLEKTCIVQNLGLFFYCVKIGVIYHWNIYHFPNIYWLNIFGLCVDQKYYSGSTMWRHLWWKNQEISTNTFSMCNPIVAQEIFVFRGRTFLKNVSVYSEHFFKVILVRQHGKSIVNL